MGSLWRNREFRRYMLLLLAAGGLCLPLCFRLHAAAGAVAAVLYAVLVGASVRFSYRRYRQIAELSGRLSSIAAGDYRMDIAEYAEGELSILASELLKITSTLAHQAERLQKDKGFLADSLADISHQLKTPLTSVSMMADLLEAPALPEEKRREFLSGLRQGLNRIQWLVASLLKLSRLDAGAVDFQPETVSLAGLVRRAAAPLEIPMEIKEITLVTEYSGALSVTTDPYWMAEAVGNLLKNCVDHTPKGGEIHIHCTQNPLYTELRLWDNGPGIAPEDLPHIFQRFYRGKHASSDSVGIGLALCKSIAGQLEGTVTAENISGGGACFTLRLYRKAAAG